MLHTILATIPRDNDYPARAFTIGWRRKALDGTLYDGLAHEFHEEKNGAGEYVPLRNRRPSVKYALCRTVVSDAIALLFSEAHFPTAQCEDRGVVDTLAALVKEARLDGVMVDAALSGSVGSVAVLMRVLGGRVFFKALHTEYLTPEWKPEAPDTLARVVERYKIKGAALVDAGYSIPDDKLQAVYWFRREWDGDAETWFLPQLASEASKAPAVDTGRTVTHSLGFVPMVWIRNLPGGDDIDGACTFAAAVENQIEIDYQLSQAGRGLKYSSDPTLVIKEPAMDGDIVKGGGNALILAQDGDAKLLEIGGTAAAAVIEYVKVLREFALESIHGNRSSADKLSAAQSGRAIELMNQGLIWLADRLRASYGEHGLLPLFRMVVAAASVVELMIDGKPVTFPAGMPITLKWPRWYQPTAEDRQADAGTLNALRAGGLMSRQTAINALADDYDIEDVAAELLLIQRDQAAEDARLIAVAAQTKAVEVVPS